MLVRAWQRWATFRARRCAHLAVLSPAYLATTTHYRDHDQRPLSHTTLLYPTVSLPHTTPRRSRLPSTLPSPIDPAHSLICPRASPVPVQRVDARCWDRSDPLSPLEPSHFFVSHVLLLLSVTSSDTEQHFALAPRRCPGSGIQAHRLCRCPVSPQATSRRHWNPPHCVPQPTTTLVPPIVRLRPGSPITTPDF